MKKDYDRNLTLICRLCGGKQFEYDDEIKDSPIKCIGCNSIYTREELIAANQENIGIHMDEMKKDIVNDVSGDLSDMLKKAFKNNKNIKFK